MQGRGSRSAMKLHIAPLSGSVFTVEAQPTWILQDLLVEVEAVRGPATLRKFFLQPGAVQLLDNKILQDCVEDGSELLVVDSSPTLVLATCSQTALLWHVDAFEPAQHFEGHTGEVTFACFSKDGKKFATTSNDGSARVWDVCLGSEIHVLVHPRVEMVRRKKPKMPPKERAAPEVKYLIPEVMHADFSPEGTKLVTTSNFDVWLWDIISGTGIHPFPRTNTFRTNFVTFSPDGSKVAGANPRTAYIWDTATGAHVQIFEADGLSCFRFLDDDRALGVTNSNDTGAGALWSVSTGELLHRFPCRDGMILSHIAPVPVPSSPGHLHVASVDHTGSVHVWDSLSGELLRSMESYLASLTRPPHCTCVASKLSEVH